MNIKNMTDEQKNEFAFLPEAAIAALQAGEEWEYEPESVDGADADVYYCDDCDEPTWHLVWTVFGLRLDADGNLFETEWTVDTDGDWSFSDEYEPGTYDHTKAHEDAQARFREYATWVVENGRDPLDEFSGGASLVRKETVWTVDFAPTFASPVVLRARKGKEKFIPVSEFPASLREFLCNDERGFMQEFESMDDLKARATGVTWVGERRATVSVGESAYPRKSRAEMVKRAKNFIKSKEATK